MEKKHLYVLVIAAIVGLMLILPASAAISFQKNTPIANTMFKPIPIKIPSVPIKNISVIDQPQLIPSIQKPVDLQIPVSPRLFNNSALIHTVPAEVPINLAVPIHLPFTVTVTVWNADHTHTVPDASITFYKFIFPEQHNNGPNYIESQGFWAELIATGKTNSNGKLSIKLITGGDKVKVNAISPVVNENGELITYSGGEMLAYESHSLDITLNSRNRVQ
jgi:hypothetical protein